MFSSVRFSVVKKMPAVFLAMLAMLTWGVNAAYAGTTPSLNSVTHKTGCDKLLVKFNEPVFSATNLTGNLAAADFAYTDASVGDMATIASVAHTAGNNWAVLTMNANAGAGDASTDILRPAANSIFTAGGALSQKSTTLGASDATAPTFSASYKAATDNLLVTFTDLVWNQSFCTAAMDDAQVVVNADFAYVDVGADNATALQDAAQHLPMRDKVSLDLDVVLAQTGDIDDTESINVANAAVFDLFGNAVAQAALDFGGAGTTSDTTVPSISSVEAVKDKTYLLVRFSEPISGAAAAATITVLANADSTDLLYTDTGGAKAVAATDLAAVAGNDWAILKLNGAIAFADLTADTVNAVAGAVFDAFGNEAAATAVAADDTTDPVILSMTFDNSAGTDSSPAASTASNVLHIVYSEDVTITGAPAANAAQASTTAIGDITTAGTLAGFGAFATPGDITYRTLCNTVALSTDGTTFTIVPALQSCGLKTAGTTVPSGVFTPTANVVDLAPTPNALETTSTQVTLTTTNAWDAVAASAQVVGFAYVSQTTTSIAVGWTAVALPGGTDIFKKYEVFQRGTTGVTLANGTLWGVASDAALATRTTATTTLTSLNSGTTYFLTIYSVDGAGNPAAAATEINVQTNSSSGSGTDKTAPGAPTSLAVEVNDSGHAVLTWTDPSATDLAKIVVLRGIDPIPVSGTSFAEVDKALQTYTDTLLSEGQIVTYILRAKDLVGNSSQNSNTVTVTVSAGEMAVETPSEEAQAEVLEGTVFEAELSGANEVPAVDTLATGLASLTLSTDEKTLTVTVTHDVTDATGAHIHGPVAAGENGPVVFDLGTPASPIQATWSNLSVNDVANLKAGNFYVNVHSSANSNGEIRGHIMMVEEEDMAEEEEGGAANDDMDVEMDNAEEPAVTGSFSDVPTGVYYQEPVSHAREQGWVQANNSFRPADNMNRCEFATVVVKARGIELASTYTAVFSDVPTGHWAAPYVYTGMAQGWWKGQQDGSGKFGCGNDLNRAEVAVIMSNVLSLTAEDTYTPADAYPSWALMYLRRVHAAGVMMGLDATNFGATQPLKRADAITALYRALVDEE